MDGSTTKRISLSRQNNDGVGRKDDIAQTIDDNYNTSNNRESTELHMQGLKEERSEWASAQPSYFRSRNRWTAIKNHLPEVVAICIWMFGADNASF